METKNENMTMELRVKDIVAGNFNPRKTFHEESLEELAQSLKTNGLIQSIIVRPKGKRYQTVVGERRFRASKLAGLETITAVVRELSDEEAIELAITENLQRENVPFIEEARAMLQLQELRQHDVPTLAALFGKSERYIRSRITLNKLIEPFQVQITEGTLSLGQAMELCKYDPAMQQEIFTMKFETDNYQSWRNKKPSELAKSITDNYTNQLDAFNFDKSDCQSCPFNSSLYDLFGEAGNTARCSMTECLKTKNISFMCQTVRARAAQHPEAAIGQRYGISEQEITEALGKEGYEIEVFDDLISVPRLPEPPVAKDGSELTEQQLGIYEKDMANYNQKLADIETGTADGSLQMVIYYTSNDVHYAFRSTKRSTSLGEKEPNDVIEQLRAKDVRNREIADEKIAMETNALVRKMEMKGKFSDLEERMLYFLLLSCLKKDHFGKIGIPEKTYYLQSADKLAAVDGLTKDQKTVIIRDFIAANIEKIDGAANQLPVDLAQQHRPEDITAIQTEHNETYQKRQRRLAERIGALEALINLEQQA